MEPETQGTEAVGDRLRLLLNTHQELLKPELLRPERDAVLIEQGQAADCLLMVNAGRLAIEVQQPEQPFRTIAVVGPGAVLGEMALFGEARHTARVRTLDADAEVLRFSRQTLHQAMLFDTELVAEILAISSERCRSGNHLINLLLDGLDACSRGDGDALAAICRDLRSGPDSIVRAASQLEQLLLPRDPDRPSP